MVSALETVTESPQSQSSLVRNPPLSRKTHGFWKASQQLQTNLLKSLSCIQMWDERGLKRIFSESWKCIFLGSKTCTADSNPSVEQPACLLGPMLLPSPLWDVSTVFDLKNQQLKLFKSMLQQKTVLSYNKNHSLLDSIILVGWKPMISNGFHASTWLKEVGTNPRKKKKQPNPQLFSICFTWKSPAFSKKGRM